MRILLAVLLLLFASPSEAQNTNSQLLGLINGIATGGANTAAEVRSVLDAMVNSTNVQGTSCPSSNLTKGQPFLNTTNGPLLDQLQVFDGTQCVQWGTLDETYHIVSYQVTANLNTTSATNLIPFTWWNVNLSGTISSTGADGINANHLFNVADNVAAGAFGLYNGYFGDVIGGASATGGRTDLFSFILVNAATADTVPNPYFYVAHASRAQATANENGTSLTPSGSLFAANDIVQLTSGATFWQNEVGREVDCEADSTTSVAFKQCFKVVLFGSDATQGSVSDYGIGLVKQSGATGSWKTGITIGEPTGYWPISSSGTIIGTQVTLASGSPPAYQATQGVDFSAVSISSCAFKSAGVCVNGSGSGQVQLTGSTSGTTTMSTGATGGHFQAKSGTAPSASSCAGYSAASGSNDTFGSASFSNATSCSLSWGTNYVVAPVCMAVPIGTAVSVTDVTTTTGGVSFNFSGTTNGVAWLCFGN